MPPSGRAVSTGASPSALTFWGGRPSNSPPLPEQKKIAAILSSVDDAIQATQAVIEQTRRVKEGLLQDLLTRGIGHTRFKQTEIGEIPEEWEVRKLGDTLSNIVAGRSPSAPDEPAPGYLWGVLKVSAVVHGDFRHEENKVLPSDFQVPLAHRVHSGDVLITRANTAQLVAASCRVPAGDYRLMLCDKTLRLEPNPTLMDADFLVASITQPRARRYFAQVATGSSASMKNVSQKKIRDLPLALPVIDEQRDIVKRILASDTHLDVQMKAVSALRQVKIGLLQDLLTGKVRVSV